MQKTTSESTSSSLLRRVRQQDPEAWVRLTKLYGPDVYAWARKCGLADADAADVVQEVFHSVAKNIAAFHRDTPGDSFRGWLWTITRHKTRDHFRDLAARTEPQGGTDAKRLLDHVPEQMPDDDSCLTTGTSQTVVHRALDLLRNEFEQKTWQIFWRMAIDGEPAGEIAEELGMTKSAVRQAKYRVARRLREELDGLADADADE